MTNYAPQVKMEKDRVESKREFTSVGEQLRRQRKARGISLVEVSEHTKISKKYLEALEEERYEILPCTTYIAGFLTSYAKYLELDHVDILRQYKATTKVDNNEEEQYSDTQNSNRENNQSVWVPLLSMLVLAGLAAGAFLLWPDSQMHPKPTIEEVNNMPNTNQAMSEEILPVINNSQEITLQIKAKDKTWVTVMVDGKIEPDANLKPGEEKTWRAQERFVLSTVNAGAIEVIFNGEIQPPLGKVGEVKKDIVFEREKDQENLEE